MILLNVSILFTLSNITFGGITGRASNITGSVSEGLPSGNASVLVEADLLNNASDTYFNNGFIDVSSFSSNNSSVDDEISETGTLNSLRSALDFLNSLFEESATSETENITDVTSIDTIYENASDSTSIFNLLDATNPTLESFSTESLLDADIQNITTTEFTIVATTDSTFPLIELEADIATSSDNLSSLFATSMEADSEIMTSFIPNNIKRLETTPLPDATHPESESFLDEDFQNATTTEFDTSAINDSTFPSGEVEDLTTSSGNITFFATSMEADSETMSSIVNNINILETTTDTDVATTVFTSGVQTPMASSTEDMIPTDEDFVTVPSNITRPTNSSNQDVRLDKETADVLEYLDCGLKPSAELSSWYRIVGGSPSQMFEWPWVVSLRSRGYHSCGATLILPRFLLTAAHCVGAGKHLVAKGASETINVKRTYIHPGFWRHYDDLALVELEEPFYNLNPICIEKVFSNLSDSMFIAGWGATKEDGFVSHNQLMSAEVVTLPGEMCSKVYGRYFTDSMICAGTQDGSTDACHGDSGGPLMHEVNGTWYLKGIISYGKGCGRDDSPGVYMKAFMFRDWIANKILSLSQESL